MTEMLNDQKIIQKFAHYWFLDDDFRLKIYRNTVSYTFNKTVFNDLLLKAENFAYSDLRLKHVELWVFLVGLLYPSRFITSSRREESFFNFGKEVGLDGRWLKIWKWCQEENFSCLWESKNQILSSYGFIYSESRIFSLGFFGEKTLNPNFSNQEKSLFLLGREIKDPTIQSSVKQMLY